MASAYVASLIAARDSAATQLAALLAGPPKPSYSVEGRSISWGEYRNQLKTEIKDLTQMIAAADGGSDVSHHVGHAGGW